MVESSPNENFLKDLEQIKKELVAEQPGLFISMTGLILALFMGVALRTLLAPEKMMNLALKAAEKIDQRFKASVTSTQISLSDGIFPEIAVIIKGLSLESEEACWMRPSIEVDELKLPVDMMRFFRGEIYIHEVLAHEVSISIRSDLSKCQKSQDRQVAQAAPTIKVQSVKKPDSAWEKFNLSRNSIDIVQFERMRVHYLPLAFTSFEVKDFNIGIESKEPKRISSSGKLVLAGETLSGDYSSTANLNLNFDESAQPEWTASVDGNWREGHYLLKALYSPAEQVGSLNVNMTQIPLNQLFPLLRKYHLLQAHYNAQQVWLSFKGEISGTLKNPKNLPAKIEQIKIEGNIGEFEANNIEINSFEPFKYKPVEVDIRSLKLDSLLTFLNSPHPNPTLGKLGSFHGKATILDSQNVKIKGEHSGFEFVFSNLLDRQVQKIGLIQADMLIRPNKWSIKIDRIKPEEGVFLGSVAIETDSSWKKQEIHAKIDELSLSPQVQKVLTNGGQLTSLSGDLDFKLEQGNITNLKGHAVTSGLKIENTLIKRSKMQFSTFDGNVTMDWLAQGLVVELESNVFKLIQPLLQPHYFQTMGQTEKLEIPLVSAQFKSQMLHNFEWNNFSFNLEKSKIKSSGGWNEKGELQGRIWLTNHQRHSQYKILGSRARPLFSEVKDE